MVAVCAASAMVLAAQLQSHMLQALKSEYAFRAHRINTLPNLPMPVSQTFPYDVSARELLMLATSKWPDMLAALESVEIAGVTPIGLD